MEITTPSLPVGTLTFLMTDVEGSTRAWSTAPHEAKLAHERHDRIVIEEIEKNQGQVVESGREGDSFTAVFGQATDAVACALGIQVALRRETWPDGIEMNVRIALHTGEAELRSGHYVGAPLYRCARMLALANGGQVLVSRATEELVADGLPVALTLRDLGVHALRDLSRPEQVFQLVHADLAADFPPLRSDEAERANLPEQLTSFVGRASELAALVELVGRARMVTLTGPGGVGKSRLAIELARATESRWPDGVWWVDLSPVDAAAQVPGAAAAALHLNGIGPATDVVRSWLRNKRSLLVLDSCEHVLTGASELCRSVLGQCRGVTIVATSREPLGVSGEARWPVKPLAEPDAVGLFEHRAQNVDPAFKITDGNRNEVIQICRGLDALPLAIELAASRLSVMSERDISRQLSDRLHLLPGAMTAALDWSYQLLTEGEASLFRRLSVFRGGFDLESANAVCADDLVPDVLTSLTGLAEKSMVVVERLDDGATRYRLLELQAAYAEDKLKSAGELHQIQKRHYDYFLASMIARSFFASSGVSTVKAARDGAWKRHEYNNLWAALKWARTHEADLGLELAAEVGTIPSGDLTQIRTWLVELLERSPAQGPARAFALRSARNLAFRQGDANEALRLARALESLARQGGDVPTLVNALNGIGSCEMDLGRLAAAEAAFREAESLVAGLGNKRLWTLIQNDLACLALVQGRYELARQIMVPCVAASRAGGASSMADLASTIATLADAELECGELEQGEATYKEVLTISREIRDHWNIVGCLGGLARVATARGDHARSVRLAGAHRRLTEEFSCMDQPWWLERLRLSEQASRQELGPAETDKAWHEGLAMDFERAVRYGLDG